jgi:hypothetical protein
MPQPFTGNEERGDRASFRAILAQHQLVQGVELPRHDFEFLRFVARQALRIQTARKHQVRLVAHVPRRQADRAQHPQVARGVAGFLLQFALRGLQRRLAGIDAALHQPQFVTMHARRVFAHQQHGVVVQQRDDNHGAVAAAVQAFVAAALAIAELQVQAFHPPRAEVVLGDAMDRRQPLRHRRSPGAAGAFAAIMRGCKGGFIPDR